ncbi:cytochrome b [Nitrogeniibacter mangrovi]|uniref:Cytochrome b n=1 Tax=Nitrogeniibacter mangrovi TaxID=2016596 RepID=A0A6C1B1J3_9RHOO|nr:cytochrome b [Nitrogeniibacter mangrovi]QID17496.1 cytochrome b [Nitrogeniibacter mangrovi]
MKSANRYGAGAIALHWIHAVIVLGLIGWGIWMADLPKGPERGWAFGIHKSFGLIAIALILVRIAWRAGHPPPLHTGLSALEEKLAKAGHRLLYVLLVLVPAAGFTSVSFTKYPLKFFGIPLPKPGYPDETLNAIFSETHEILAWTLLAVIVIHVAAAIRHGVRGDGTLRRMLPGAHQPEP